MRRLEFTLAVKPFGEAAKKDAKKLTDEIRGQDTAVTRLAKNTTKLLGDNRFAFKSVEDAARKSTDVIKSGFERATGAVEKLNDKLKDKTKETLKDIGRQFKLAFAVFSGERLIEKAFDFPKRLMEAGRGDINARMRARREFGGDAGYMDDRAKRLGRNAGLDDSEAMNALFSIGEAVSGTQAGTAFRGKKLNGGQANALRRNTFNFGADLLERIATVTHAQGDETASIAQALSNAGTGPEGMRGLVSMLHLNRAFSAEALKANEKGKLADLVGPDMARQFGVQRGKVAGQGTLIDILLTKSGITEGAAKEERSKFDFQIKSIGASFESVLGEIGSRSLEKVDAGFAKGTTLAEKFQNILESPKGKQTIEHIADSLAKGAESAIKLATSLPRAFDWIGEHKGTIELLIGAYTGLSVLGKLRGGGKGGALETAGGLLGITKPIPVYIVNGPGGLGGALGGEGKGAGGLLGKAGKVVGALGFGLAVGTAIDQQYDVSGGLEKGVHLLTANKENLSKPDQIARSHWWDIAKGVVTGNMDTAAKKASEDLVRQTVANPSAIIPQLPPQTINVVLPDGRVLASVVNDANANKIKNATAGIPQ